MSYSGRLNICSKKLDIIDKKTRKYNNYNLGIISAIKKDKTFKKVKSCRKSKSLVKKYYKCSKKTKKNQNCNETIKTFNKNYKNCSIDISKKKIKIIKKKLNTIKGYIFNKGNEDRQKRFRKIQCDLLIILKFLSNKGINLNKIQYEYLNGIDKGIHNYYGRIFFDTIMNDGSFMNNLGYAYFVVPDLKKKVVDKFVETIEKLIKNL